MNHKKLALASVITALSGFAALATPAAAKTEVHVSFAFNASAPAYCPPAPVVVERYHRPAGYWKEITVKTWVPATWTTSCDRHGRTVRIYQPGYFAYRTDRVWVSYRG